MRSRATSSTRRSGGSSASSRMRGWCRFLGVALTVVGVLDIVIAVLMAIDGTHSFLPALWGVGALVPGALLGAAADHLGG